MPLLGVEVGNAWGTSGCLFLRSSSDAEQTKGEAPNGQQVLNTAFHEHLCQRLTRVLRYDAPLPVQRYVLPVVHRSILSGLPLDICLSAPTGSGKTLCYVLPMLSLIAEEKARHGDTLLRGVILVPTKALGAQVYDVTQQLLRRQRGGEKDATDDSFPSRIHVALLMGDSNKSCRAELATLSRQVTLPASGGEGPQQGPMGRRYFPTADVIITTPQRLLKLYTVAQEQRQHTTDPLPDAPEADVEVAGPFPTVDSLNARGGDAYSSPLSLRHLKFWVMDEADQMMGSGTNFIMRLLQYYDAEVARWHTHQLRLQAIEQQQLLVPRCGRGATATLPVLHKILCSATLTRHIARISEVRLQNCKYLSLDSNGEILLADLTNDSGVQDEEVGLAAANSHTSGEGGLQAARSQAFALPPNLHEHVYFTAPQNRHAVLLKLVRHLIVTHMTPSPSSTEKSASALETEAGAERGSSQSRQEGDSQAAQLAVCPKEDMGHGILVFCATADTTRVLGHLLASSGLPVVEFTTMSSDSERRQALLKSPLRSTAGVQAAAAAAAPTGLTTALSREVAQQVTHLVRQDPRIRIVVSTDALTRGVDIPDVGHVIMYDPPRTVAQYIHRVGRTARAHKSGHAHLLASKFGPTGNTADGEVAHWLRISASLRRTGARKVQYERHFFMTAEKPMAVPESRSPIPAARRKHEKAVQPPASNASEPETPATELSDASVADPRVLDSMQVLADANALLAFSQRKLRMAWQSALESSAAAHRRAPPPPPKAGTQAAPTRARAEKARADSPARKRKRVT